jgi:hypothetical protein
VALTQTTIQAIEHTKQQAHKNTFFDLIKAQRTPPKDVHRSHQAKITYIFQQHVVI